VGVPPSHAGTRSVGDRPRLARAERHGDDADLVHGGSEKPDRAWRGITEAYPFVICPLGWGGNESRLGWTNPSDTSQRIAASAWEIAITAAASSQSLTL